MNPVIAYENLLDGATITVTSTKAGYDKANLYDPRRYTKWMNDTAAACDITVDFGSAMVFNSLGLAGHNLGTCGATMAFEYSATGAWAGEEVDLFTPYAPADDKDILEVFNSETKGYVRLRISGTLSEEPYIGVMLVGARIDFPQPPDPYDVYDEGTVAKDNISELGEQLESIIKYHPVNPEYEFSQLLRTWVVSTYKAFYDSYGKKRKHFLVAPDLDTFPGLVYWVRFKKGYRFQMPISISTYVDRLKVSLEGRSY